MKYYIITLVGFNSVSKPVKMTSHGAHDSLESAMDEAVSNYAKTNKNLSYSVENIWVGDIKPPKTI